MATSLSELLDDIDTSAADTAVNVLAADDARLALGQLGSALHRLAVDGLDSVADSRGADPLDPERARWAAELAAGCSRAGAAPIVADDAVAGRLAQLAGAAGVTATLYRDELTGGERWATTVALTDTVLGLTRLAQGPHTSDAAARALAVVDAAATVVSKLAAVDPPSIPDSRVLDRAVPNPFPMLRTVDEQISEAFAGLLHTTRPGTGPHSAATVLAVCYAAETVCSATELGTETERTRHDSIRAAAGWADVRTALTPFNDGSRRPHDVGPPPVEHALALHRAVQHALEAQPASPSDPPSAAVTSVVTRLSTIAHYLSAAIVDAADSGRLLAYARDLPMRESRVAQFLAGHRSGGLVAADRVDVGAVTASLRRAEDLSVTLAEGVSDQRSPRSASDAGLQATAWPAPARVTTSAGDQDIERSQQQRDAASVHAASRSLQVRQSTSGPRR